MARKIRVNEDGKVYRAVVTRPGTNGPRTTYEGPYETPGAAQARVTFWVNYFRKSEYRETGESAAAGHIECADVVWRPVD